MTVAPDLDQVRHWWRRWPDANVGIVTGAVSRLVVLDVDPRHGGEGSLGLFEDLHGAVPRTVESLTGGGGQHFYFCHPGIVVPNYTIAAGLDVKGDGGLVVCPPSVHVSGRSYVWETGCAPDETPVGDLPWWVLASLQTSRAPHVKRESAAQGRAPRTEGERAEFAALWALAGIKLVPGDRNYLCPFHPDHHPSLHIDAEGCRFYCFGCGRGGGSVRLMRLVGAPGRTNVNPPVEEPSRARIPSLPVTLAGDTAVRVVGESAYQTALLELAGGKRHYGGAHIETFANLIPEPANPADPHAIAVLIGGRKVGYLSRRDAARHALAVLSAIARFGEATCAAVIVGGWEREHNDVGLFGVRLRLRAPGEIAAASRSPRPTEV